MPLTNHFFVWYNDTKEVKLVYNIFNGKKIDNAQNPFLIRAENNSPVIAVVLDGIASVGGTILNAGDSYILPAGVSAEVLVKAPLSYARFDVDGVDAQEGFAVSAADKNKLLAFVQILFDEDGFAEGDSLFYTGAANMLVSLTGASAAFESSGNKHVDMAKRYIDRNYALPIKVEDIAEEIGVDRKYLRNLFFKCFSVSTKDYITGVRMEKAKELLADKSLAVNEIALAVGYSDALGFSKIFKKHTGVSPSEYRNDPDSASADTVVSRKPAKAEESAPKEDIKYFLL